MQVTLVATAPLTNLAVAVQLDPSISDKLEALYIMGGNMECESLASSKKNLLSTFLLQSDGRVCVCVCAARGNTTVCGEFNFVADPEAAFIVLDRYTCPTHIASWEFSCANSLPWVKGKTVCSKLIFHSSPPPWCCLWRHFSIPHDRSGVSVEA